MGRALGKTGTKAMARAPMKTGAKAMVRAAGKSGETSRGRVAGTSSILLKGSVAGGAASRSGPQSFDTGDNAADQIVSIEGAKIDPGSIRYGFEPGHQFGEAALCIPAEHFPCFDRNCDKAQPITRAAAPDDRQVSRHDRGNFRVSAGRLVIGEGQGWRPRSGHLDSTGRDRI